MAAASALTSDHVNLMILRYLEEHGHENTAHAFWRDWHRPSVHRDPETLPFAPSIGRNELISVIQHGLFYDDLQSRVRKNERRFRWTQVTVRDIVDRQDGIVEPGLSSRPPSSNRPKGRLAQPQSDFPTPAPKRLRRSEGSEPTVNGDHDAMDVDAASADAEEDRDAVSPTVVSESEAQVVAERYDSMDVATQTDVEVGPKTSVMYWDVDKPEATVLHAMWNPNSNAENVNTLLTVGESLCRFYHVPQDPDGTDKLTRADETAIPDNFIVTASAWRPDGYGAACSVDALHDLNNGTNQSSQMLVECSGHGDSYAHQLPRPFLDFSGLVLFMEYSPSAGYLLVGRSDLKRGSVQIWNTARKASAESEPSQSPTAWRILEDQVLDAAWIGDDAFLVCGDNGLSSLYQIDQSQQSGANAELSIESSIAMRGLISLNSKLLKSDLRWDKLCFGAGQKVAAFASLEARKLVLAGPLSPNESGDITEVELDLPGELTSLAFQRSDESQAGPGLLAATFEDGFCVVYSLDRHSDEGLKCSEVISLNMADGPALALAWSPNKDHLAVANADLVQIWHIDSFKRKNGVVHGAKPLITWAEDFDAAAQPNGMLGNEKPTVGPSLSYSADGQCLAFVVDKHIAVMRFHSPSTNDQPNALPNGAPVPIT